MRVRCMPKLRTGPCVRGGGGGAGERRGRLGQPSSLGVADRFPGPKRPVLGAAGSLGMVLGTGVCAHPTLLVRAVPGPRRPGLRTRHPAHG